MKQFKSFLKDTSGNFAIMASIAMVPVLLAVGLGIDYAGASKQRTEMQQALDSASLAIMKAGETITDDQARQIAINYLGENFHENWTDLDVDRVGTKVDVTVKTPYKLNFGTFFGRNSVDLTVAASAEISRLSNEIALVLDTTGSMEGGKLTAMQEAVVTMIDNMSAVNTNKQNLKFALVPFSNFVNVGPDFGPTFNGAGKQNNDGADWLDLDGMSPIQQVDLQVGLSRFQLFKHLGYEWPGCVETRPEHDGTAYDVTDAAAIVGKPESLFVPAFDIDEPDNAGQFPNSYISSDSDPLDFTAPGLAKKLNKYGIPVNASGKPNAIGTWTTPAIDSSVSTFYSNYHVNKGPDFNCSTQPIMPLTTNYQAVKDAVDDLEAAGSTNIMEGVAWGWRVLSEKEPFTEGRTSNNPNNRKIIVLLTDGSNSFGNLENSLGSAYSSMGYLVDERLVPVGSNAATTNAALDAKTLAACTNAKADGIEIYTIQLEVDSATTSELLKQCATDEDHYMNVPDRDQLGAAFSKIDDKITGVRLSG